MQTSYSTGPCHWTLRSFCFWCRGRLKLSIQLLISLSWSANFLPLGQTFHCIYSLGRISFLGVFGSISPPCLHSRFCAYICGSWNSSALATNTREPNRTSVHRPDVLVTGLVLVSGNCLYFFVYLAVYLKEICCILDFLGKAGGFSDSLIYCTAENKIIFQYF